MRSTRKTPRHSGRKAKKWCGSLFEPRLRLYLECVEGLGRSVETKAARHCPETWAYFVPRCGPPAFKCLISRVTGHLPFARPGETHSESGMRLRSIFTAAKTRASRKNALSSRLQLAPHGQRSGGARP